MSHSNNSTYMPAFNCPLTAQDIARIRQDVIAAGETIHWPRLAQMWDIPINRVQSLANRS
jgi:hypothetical protein